MFELAAISRGPQVLTFVGAGGLPFRYAVVEECSGVAVVAIFWVATLAVPKVAVGRRLVGMVAGTVLIFSANWLRLLSLAWVGVHQPAYFDLAHAWLWQGIAVALVTALWLFWLDWALGIGTGRRMTLQRAAIFTTCVTAMAALLHLADGIQWYGAAVERGVWILQWPWASQRDALAVGEWDQLVSGATFALAVALVAATFWPRRAAPLLAFASMPLIYAIHVVAIAAEAYYDSSYLRDWTGRSLDVPTLIAFRAVPLLIPLLVGLWVSRPISPPEACPAEAPQTSVVHDRKDASPSTLC